VGMNQAVYTLLNYQGKLFAGGAFTLADGMLANRIAYWQGNGWMTIGNGFNSTVYTLAANDQLYAGGWFTQADSIATHYIARWGGNSWSAIGSGMNSGVETINFYQQQLIAGCSFTQAGGKSISYLARFYDPLSIKTISSKMYELKMIPNPFSSSTTILFPKQVYEGDLFVYDALGKLVKTISAIRGNSYFFSTANLLPGNYFFVLKTLDGLSFQGKCMIEP